MAKILKRTSFGLLRTNPRLTTNIKVITDSSDNIFLESIDADPLLSKSIFKGYQVNSDGSYSYDLQKFWSQNNKQTPKDIAYKVFEYDKSLTVKERYGNQYDFTYDYGMTPKISRLYSEEYSLFAPIWLEKDNLPDYFIIFRIDGPVTVNANSKKTKSIIGSDANLDTNEDLNNLVISPENFFKNYIQRSEIIKTFDLTKSTNLGNYLRNHIEDSGFPESSLYANLEKTNLTYWQGISYNSGGFCKIADDIYKDYILTDKTMIQSDDYITNGFKQNGVIVPNIINMEFLFDDIDQTKYSFNRYFGLYVNESELGQFLIDKDRLYQDKDIEADQVPRPIISDFGDPLNFKTQIQTNKNGIKVYPKIENDAPYSGRLLTFDEIQKPRLPYVKDALDNFYSINSINNWKSNISLGPTSYIDTDYIRLKNKKVDWKTFGGFDKPFQYIQSYVTSKRGRPSISFKVTGTVNPGDEIRVRYTDWSDANQIPLIDFYTIEGTNILSSGVAQSLSFSIKGTKTDIASAISKAINNIQINLGEEQIFYSISKGDEVIVYCKVDSENWNKLRYSLFSSSTTFPFTPGNSYVNVNQTLYKPSPISGSPLQNGKYYEAAFTGGNNNPNSRIIIDKESVNEFKDDTLPIDKIYVKTNNGYSTIANYSIYTDIPVYGDNGEIISFTNSDKFYVLNLEKNLDNILITSSKIGLYKPVKNSTGYLSILPIKDFDFDFHNIDYAKDADSNTTDLWNWYKSGTAGTSPLFIYGTGVGEIGVTGINSIDSLIGPTSAFVINGGFQTLEGIVNNINDTTSLVINEYDRLKENDSPELALSSRVVPFINKWVYDNESVDVRENPYRLNTDQAFGYSNFSPVNSEISSNKKFFTHEWLYLQQYPPYMSFYDKVNSFSYFDEDIYAPSLPEIGSSGSTSIYNALISATGPSANLLSINENYFVDYFTRETVGGTAIIRDFKYSIFSFGDDIKFPETLFRGVKVLIKRRSEFSQINYNQESKKFLGGSKLNDYKFSGVITYSDTSTDITFIKNDKWKTVSMIVKADLVNDLLKYTKSGDEFKFIDRSSLYTIKSKWNVNGGLLEYENVILSGSLNGNGVNIWEDLGGVDKFKVFGTIDFKGILPDFLSEITQNENGSYNNIQISDGINTFTFTNIFNIQANTFNCESITGPGFGTINSNGSNTLDVNGGGLGWSLANRPLYLAPLAENPIYIGGGFNAISRVLEEISFANISFLVNNGDPNIRYISVSESGAISSNDFFIELVEPDGFFKGSYLDVKPTEYKPSKLNESSSGEIIGYDIKGNSSLVVSEMLRNRGGYNPKVKDVINFIDTDDIKNEGLDYLNIQIFTKEDEYQDLSFGNIYNLYYNKVNTENPNIILDYRDDNRFLFPAIGQIAIDYRDFFVFRSNWDPQYFISYENARTKVPVIGTRGVIENKSFFGSKVISIPDDINIETFSSLIEDADLPKLNDALINRIPVHYKLEGKRARGGRGVNDKGLSTTGPQGKNLTVRVFSTIGLEDYLINDGFDASFIEFIDPNYSFGDVNLDDDVRQYIQFNILQRYDIEEVVLWQKTYTRTTISSTPLPLIQVNLNDIQKAEQGFIRVKNFTYAPLIVGSLNFDLIYTIPTDRNVSLAIDVILKKK